MSYNLERLKEDADCREVARSIGMKICGQFCECVSGTHSETQINHCSLGRQFYHCFSCGDSGDVIKLVRSYYANVLGTPITLAESCLIIGDAALGGHELYEERTQESTVEKPPFTTAELELLGFCGADYSESATRPIRMENIFRENKILYYQLVRNKAEQQLLLIENLVEHLGDSVFEGKIKVSLQTRHSDVTGLFERAGGKLQKVKKMYKL